MKTFVKIALITALILGILGLGLVLAGLALGGNFLHYFDYQDWDTETIQESFEAPIENLHIKVGAGNVQIIPGESYGLIAHEVPQGLFSHDFENGTLNIEADFSQIKKWRPDNMGFIIRNFSAFLWNKGRQGNYALITITLPQEAYLNRLELEGAAADILVQGLSCDIFQAEIAAGRLRGQQITAAESCRISISAGESDLEEVFFKNLHAVTEAGSFELTGALIGESSINTIVGSAQLDIWGQRQDYQLSLENSAGSISIDGEDMHESGSRELPGSAGKHQLKIRNEVGSTELTFSPPPFGTPLPPEGMPFLNTL